MNRLLYLLSLLIVVTLASFGSVSAQLFGPNFYCHIIEAPGKQLGDAKKIAILNFEDDNSKSYSYWNNTQGNGSKVADYMIGELLNEKRGIEDEEKLYFAGFKPNLYTIVERSQLDKIIEEQKMGSSGALNDSEAVEVGKLLGIDIIVTGSISHSHKDETDHSTRKDKEGNVIHKYIATRTVYAESRIKLISVETGEVLATTSFKKQSSDSRSDKKYVSPSKLKPIAEIANSAYKLIAGDMVKYFTPSLDYTGLSLLKVKTKEYKKQAKEAVKFIKDGSIDKALLIYKEIYESDPYNQEVAFNLGSLYEGTGHFTSSLECYKVALELDGGKEKYKNAVARVEKTIETVEALKELDITITPYEFAKEGSSKLAAKITTKGSKKDRVEVKSDKSKGSDTIAKIPGGTEFEVISDEGDWIKIKILGGKEGYIEKRNTK